MRITELHLAADTDRRAVLRRSRQAVAIEVEIITRTGTVNHQVTADDQHEIRGMAQTLHVALEGVRGSAGDIHDYYRALESMSDL